MRLLLAAFGSNGRLVRRGVRVVRVERSRKSGEHREDLAWSS